MSGTFHRVLKLAELPPGAKKPVQVGKHCILLCNPGDKLHAISNVCSHALQMLEKGRMTPKYIVCPTHGARFELATGKPMNPPAFKPIAVYELRVAEEWIEVRADDTPAAAVSG